MFISIQNSIFISQIYLLFDSVKHFVHLRQMFKPFRLLMRTQNIDFVIFILEREDRWVKHRTTQFQRVMVTNQNYSVIWVYKTASKHFLKIEFAALSGKESRVNEFVEVVFAILNLHSVGMHQLFVPKWTFNLMKWRFKESKFLITSQRSQQLYKIRPLKITCKHYFDIKMSVIQLGQHIFEQVFCVWSEKHLFCVDAKILLEFFGKTVHEALLKPFVCW